MSNNQRLTITTHSDGPMQRVAIAGELDASTAPSLQEQLEASPVCDDSAILDLSEITFVDSAGLGVIVAAHGTWMAAGREFVLEGVPERVLSVITYAGLLDHLDIR